MNQILVYMYLCLKGPLKVWRIPSFFLHLQLCLARWRVIVKRTRNGSRKVDKNEQQVRITVSPVESSHIIIVNFFAKNVCAFMKSSARMRLIALLVHAFIQLDVNGSWYCQWWIQGTTSHVLLTWMMWFNVLHIVVHCLCPARRKDDNILKHHIR